MSAVYVLSVVIKILMYKLVELNKHWCLVDCAERERDRDLAVTFAGTGAMPCV